MFKCLKFIFILIGSLPISSFAQEVKGVVKDLNSRLPIADVKIITAKETTLTNNEGKFTLQIYLKQNAIVLMEVEVKTKRNHKFDSLAIRKEYANAFTYKGPNISDMFIEKDINYDSPFGFTNPRSTASIVSLSVLQIINLFSKKQVQTTRLKQTLLRDEELYYMDYVFSKDKIKSLTGLGGEQLLTFMNRYRPSALTLKKMTGYELTIYIKKSYQEFAIAKL